MRAKLSCMKYRATTQVTRTAGSAAGFSLLHKTPADRSGCDLPSHAGGSTERVSRDRHVPGQGSGLPDRTSSSQTSTVGVWRSRTRLPREAVCCLLCLDELQGASTVEDLRIQGDLEPAEHPVELLGGQWPLANPLIENL